VVTAHRKAPPTPPKNDLADIGGDGRADLCAVTTRSVDCAMAP
jgi:hypothetical protein